MKNLFSILLFAISTSIFAQMPAGEKFQYERFVTQAKQDKTTFEQNFLLGCRYYNTAVDVLSELDANKEEQQVASIQEKSLDYFNKALPYFELCFKENPNDAKTLKALCGIYFAKNDANAFDHYKSLIQKTQ